MTETAQNLATPETLHCANHPDRETMLRCNRCDKPICFDCAVLTEVGYRCRECVRAQRAGYYNAAPTDAIIGALIAIGLGALFGLLAYLLLGLLGFFRLIAALPGGAICGWPGGRSDSPGLTQASFADPEMAGATGLRARSAPG